MPAILSEEALGLCAHAAKEFIPLTNPLPRQWQAQPSLHPRRPGTMIAIPCIGPLPPVPPQHPRTFRFGMIWMQAQAGGRNATHHRQCHMPPSSPPQACYLGHLALPNIQVGSPLLPTQAAAPRSKSNPHLFGKIVSL